MDTGAQLLSHQVSFIEIYDKRGALQWIFVVKLMLFSRLLVGFCLFHDIVRLKQTPKKFSRSNGQ